MRNLALASVLYGLAVHAAPAPQAADPAAGMPTLQGPEGFCSAAGEYWNGTAYVPCGLDRFCRDHVCGFETTPLPAGVTGPAATAASSQATELAAGVDAPAASAQTIAAAAVTSANVHDATIAAAATSANVNDSTMAAAVASDAAEATSLGISIPNKAAQPQGTALQAGADKPYIAPSSASDLVPAASGVTSAQNSAATGTPMETVLDPNCVDDSLTNSRLKLTKSPDYEWKMTGPRCTPRISNSTAPRFVAYWNQWSLGATLPDSTQLTGVTHFVLSFAASDGSGWTPQTAEGDPSPFDITKIKQLKDENPGMKVLAAFGGWNLDAGFSKEADSGNMRSLAEKIVLFRQTNELDGIDIDWEYPVGGGSLYKACAAPTEDKKLPERPYERDALVDLLRHIRAIDPDTHLSLAAPARKADRELSFPKETITEVDRCLDDWNLMTYDMMNRRDLKTTHHAGSAVIKDVVDYYSSNGIEDKKRLNIGFSLYAKYFTLSNSTSEVCTGQGGIGCDIYPAEGIAGEDLGTSGAWVFNQPQNNLTSPNVATDYTLKLAKPSWDSMPDEAETHNAGAGASSWADVKNRMFWTWTSTKDIEQSCADHMKDVGGVMVWSVNQDVNGVTGGPHMEAIAACVGGGAADGNAGSSGVTSAVPSGQTSANGGATTNLPAAGTAASANTTAPVASAQ